MIGDAILDAPILAYDTITIEWFDNYAIDEVILYISCKTITGAERWWTFFKKKPSEEPN